MLVRSNDLRCSCRSNSLRDTFLLSFGNLFQQFSIHACFFRVHLASKFKLSFYFNIRGVFNCVRVCLHLFNLEILCFFDFFLSFLLSLFALCLFNFCLLCPFLHVRFVCTILFLFLLSFSVDLCIEDISDLLVLLFLLQLFIHVLSLGSFIQLNTLLNIFFFLSLLKFFVFVVYDVCHSIHHCLNTCSSLSDVLFTFAFLLLLRLIHFFNIVVLFYFSLFFIGKTLLFLLLVFTYHSLSSLSFFNFSNNFILFFSFQLIHQLLCNLFLLIQVHFLFSLFLDFCFLEHSVSHLFVSVHVFFFFLELLLFNFHLKLRLFQNFFVEIVLFL